MLWPQTVMGSWNWGVMGKVCAPTPLLCKASSPQVQTQETKLETCRKGAFNRSFVCFFNYKMQLHITHVYSPMTLSLVTGRETAAKTNRT